MIFGGGFLKKHRFIGFLPMCLGEVQLSTPALQIQESKETASELIGPNSSF